MILASQNVQIAEEKDFVREKISGIFFVNSLQTKEHCESSALLFGTMCSAPAERDAHFVRDVSFGSDVRFARE